MKKSLLIPILLTTSVPLATITSCNNSGLVAIPKNCLNIKHYEQESIAILYGFKTEYQTAQSLEGYSKLTIPAEVNEIRSDAFKPEPNKDAPLVIKQIDFEPNCKIPRLGKKAFSGCINLETVVFPPKYIARDEGTFDGCANLKTFDLSNIEVNIPTISDVETDFIMHPETLPDNGQIIIRNGQTNVDGFIAYLLSRLETKGWTVVTK